MVAPPGRGAARWRTFAEVVLSTWFLAAAALFALTTLCAIVNFGWRQPMFDQWREYEIFLGLPFPQNVLQLMNGHRPILPNLIRVAEIHWFAASQVLQIAVGSACAYASAAILALVAWRERQLSVAVRCAGVMLAVVGVLWLGNARRLLHGSESLNGYLPTVLALLASLLAFDAARAQRSTGAVTACILCTLATFSFGLGLASFFSVLAVLFVLRARGRQIAIVAGVMTLAFIAYAYLLPGNGGVRQQLVVEPVDTLRLLAQWIAAPWKTAWLDIATLPFENPLLDMPHRLLQASAARMLAATGGDVDHICLLLGAIGIVAFALVALDLVRRAREVSRLQAVALGAAVYALLSGVITVAARLPILHELPEQVYADRYLVWPALFWCALGLLALAAVMPKIPVLRFPAMLLLALLPLAMVVSQNSNAVWGALVYREAQRSAALLQSGVLDDSQFPGEALGIDAHIREIDVLRKRRLAMFADPTWLRLGTRWEGTLEKTDQIAVQVQWLPPANDSTTHRPVGHCEGVVTAGNGPAHRGGRLAILDDTQAIVGFAEFSFIRSDSRALLLRMPNKRGFDGYVRDYDDTKAYSLVLLDVRASRAFVLATLPSLRQAVEQSAGLVAADPAAR